MYEEAVSKTGSRVFPVRGSQNGGGFLVSCEYSQSYPFRQLFHPCAIDQKELYLELVVKSISILDIHTGKVWFCFLVDVPVPDLPLLAALEVSREGSR